MNPKTIHYHCGAAIPSDSAQSVHVMKMCEAWSKAGHAVVLFCKNGISRDDVFDYYDIHHAFKIMRAPAPNMRFLSGLIRIIHGFFASLLSPKPDIIYGRDPVSLAMQKWRKCSVILELHQMPKPWVLRCFKKLVVISKALKNDTDVNDVFVYHDCASISNKVTPVELIEPESFNVGYAGSLHKGKGGGMIINLANACPHYKFHVWGGKPEQIESLKNDAKHNNVSFYGHTPHHKVHAYLKHCDVLIAPYSKNITIQSGADISRWTSPLKIFEYMAAEKPMIVSDLPVIREILTNGHNAILTEPDNVHDWKEALNQIYENRKFGDNIAKQAYSDFLNHYTWDKRAEAILKFCTEQ